MKKQIGNIEVEIQEITNCSEPYLVSLSVRTSTVKMLTLLPDDARDLVYGLQWALGLRTSSSYGCTGCRSTPCVCDQLPTVHVTGTEIHEGQLVNCPKCSQVGKDGGL